MDKQELLKDNTVSDTKDSVLSITNNKGLNGVYKAVSLKTERLVSAIHLVTGLMDTKETIRWELRTASIMTVSDLYFLSASTGSVGAVSDKILKKISHIISLLEVGLTAGLISQMNYSILKEEYLKLKEILLKFQLTDSVDSLILSGQFFGPDLGELNRIVPVDDVTRDTTANRIKDIDKMSFIKKEETPNRTLKIKNNNVKDKKDKSVRADKVSRQDIILNSIKPGEGYTIKDIINEVSISSPGMDCSSKTIQRDLLSLVAGGVLKKSGERRWSRYSRN